MMSLIEGEASGFSSIPTSIYWAIVTMTTVGYGDIAPHTAVGKILASAIMILGYGIIAVPTGIVSVELAGVVGRKITTQACLDCGAGGHDRDAVHCKYCGAKLGAACAVTQPATRAFRHHQARPTPSTGPRTLIGTVTPLVLSTPPGTITTLPQQLLSRSIIVVPGDLRRAHTSVEMNGHTLARTSRRAPDTSKAVSRRMLQAAETYLILAAALFASSGSLDWMWAWAMIPSALIACQPVLRTALEDRKLQHPLPGYRASARRVHYRLMPDTW
jgi:hypothetical protein